MPTSAFFTVADRPPSSSISILSRIAELLLLDLGDLLPAASSSFHVSRIRTALPLTLNTLSPESSSIQ